MARLLRGSYGRFVGGGGGGDPGAFVLGHHQKLGPILMFGGGVVPGAGTGVQATPLCGSFATWADAMLAGISASSVVAASTLIVFFTSLPPVVQVDQSPPIPKIT